MPTLAPILGNSTVIIGYTATLTNATTGGTWASSDTAIATVSSVGVVTGVAQGTCSITYTVGDESMAFTMSVARLSVTNGFDIARVSAAFAGRIGWPVQTLSGMPVLSEANTTSYSGRYYSDFHASCTIQNLYNAQDNSAITDDEFNALLQALDLSVTMRCLNAIFNRPALIEKCLCYTRRANVLNVQIPNGGNFVGYRLNIAQGNYCVVLNAISLYFNGVATFNLYLYNDLVKAPLISKSVTTQANSQTRVSLDWAIQYINQNNLGGVYFIGYRQSDLGSVKALDEQLNLWENSKIFGGFPFQATELPDLDFYRINPSVVYRSYGLNLEVSCYRDYTQMIVENVQLLDEAKGLAMAATVVEQVKYGTRSNGVERISQSNLATLDLDLNNAFPTQEQPYFSGLKSQLVRALKQANDNFWPKLTAKSVPLDGGSNWGDYQYLGFDTRALPPRGGIV